VTRASRYRQVRPVTTGIVIAGVGFDDLGMGITLKKAGCTTS